MATTLPLYPIRNLSTCPIGSMEHKIIHAILSDFPYTEQEIKQHYKTKEWLEYNGIVEYYVTDDYPTIKSQLKAIQQGKLHWGWIGGDYNRKNNKEFGGIAVKRTAKAEIDIQPFKLRHNWRCYNIFLTMWQ